MRKLKKIVNLGLCFALFFFFCAINLSCDQTDPDVLAHRFTSMEEIYPSHVIHHQAPIFSFESSQRDLDITYSFIGNSYTLEQLFERTSTTSFIVVKNAQIVYERYFKNFNQDTRFTSMSMAKSFVSALVGIAIEEGLIGSVHDPITQYVPELKTSGYDNVPIKHILQMSSGVDFNEDYSRPMSDINVMQRKVLNRGQPINEYISELTSGRSSGEQFHYISVDTQALGMLLKNVTGKNLATYLEEKIWRPLGMESNASWNTDYADMELAFGYINAISRDYAKFGLLYLNRGNWNGNQIIPEDWVMESVFPDSPHLQAENTGEGWGYQYQWWIPQNADGEFLACGVYGQYIYVFPKRNLVIVKTSADPNMSDGESLAAFRAIAEYLE